MLYKTVGPLFTFVVSNIFIVRFGLFSGATLLVLSLSESTQEHVISAVWSLLRVLRVREYDAGNGRGRCRQVPRV